MEAVLAGGAWVFASIAPDMVAVGQKLQKSKTRVAPNQPRGDARRNFFGKV